MNSKTVKQLRRLSIHRTEKAGRQWNKTLWRRIKKMYNSVSWKSRGKFLELFDIV